jgi:proline dehydrogenase
MNIELEAAASLRHLALNEDVKTYVLQNPPIYQRLLRAATRFIGGETLDQCVEVAKALNKAGFAVTIDYMGETTRGKHTPV